MRAAVVRPCHLFIRQVVILFAGVKGFIDRVDVDKVTAYEKAWLDHIKASHSVSSKKSIDNVDSRPHKIP